MNSYKITAPRGIIIDNYGSVSPCIAVERDGKIIGLYPSVESAAVDALSTDKITIYNGSVSINSNVSVPCDLRVYFNGSLAITSSRQVQFAESKKLEVYGILTIGDNAILTKSGTNYWAGIEINNNVSSSMGVLYMGSGITIEYATTGIKTYDSDGDVDCTGTCTIRNCGTGIYVSNKSPWIRKVKLENITGDAIYVTGSSAAPNIYYVTVDGGASALTSHAINGLNGSDSILKYSILKNTNNDCIELSSDSGIDIAWAYTDVYPNNSYKAIDNTASPSLSIYVNNTYWGEPYPSANALFTTPGSVSYSPFSASAYNNGAPAKIAVDLIANRNPFHEAHDYEMQGDIARAFELYETIVSYDKDLHQKRMAIKSMLRLCEDYDLDFMKVRTIIGMELLSAKTWYKASLDFISCDVLACEGKYTEAVQALIDKSSLYPNSSMGVQMLCQAAYISGKMLNDKEQAKRYADQAAQINPGDSGLILAYEAADCEYDISEHEDIFKTRESLDETDNEKTGELPIIPVSVSPNPANPVTTITYTLPAAGNVTLSVYSVSGQKIMTLVDGFMSIGNHAAVFDGSNFASGIYFYRLETKGFAKTGKMLLVK